jgi:hypothetical protein
MNPHVPRPSVDPRGDIKMNANPPGVSMDDQGGAGELARADLEARGTPATFGRPRETANEGGYEVLERGRGSGGRFRDAGLSCKERRRRAGHEHCAREHVRGRVRRATAVHGIQRIVRAPSAVSAHIQARPGRAECARLRGALRRDGAPQRQRSPPRSLRPTRILTTKQTAKRDACECSAGARWGRYPRRHAGAGRSYRRFDGRHCPLP